MTKEVQKALMLRVVLKAARRAHLRPHPKDPRRPQRHRRVAAVARVAVDPIQIQNKIAVLSF